MGGDIGKNFSLPLVGGAGGGVDVPFQMRLRFASGHMRSLFLLASVLLPVLGGLWVPCWAQHMNSSEAPCRGVSVTADMAQCLDRAYENADHELNEAYEEIQKVLASPDRQNLEDAERAWVKYRDATCTAERSLYENGTAAAPAYSACLEAETRQRAIDLRMTYGWKVEKARQ